MYYIQKKDVGLLITVDGRIDKIIVRTELVCEFIIWSRLRERISGITYFKSAYKSSLVKTPPTIVTNVKAISWVRCLKS